MPATGESQASTPSTPAAKTASAGGGEIDLQALAEKILQLLKNEARLERERLGRHMPW